MQPCCKVKTVIYNNKKSNLTHLRKFKKKNKHLLKTLFSTELKTKISIFNQNNGFIRVFKYTEDLIWPIYWKMAQLINTYLIEDNILLLT